MVVDDSLLDIRRIAPRRNVAEEPQGIRLVAAFLVLTGVCQRTLGEGARLLHAAGQEIRFPVESKNQNIPFLKRLCARHRPLFALHSPCGYPILTDSARNNGREDKRKEWKTVEYLDTEDKRDHVG